MHIDRPPDAVFDFMLDFSNAPRWRNLVRRIDVVTPGPIRVGSELLITIDVMGRTRQARSEVWACDRPHRFGVRNTENDVTGIFEYLLEPDASGTTVRFSCDIQPHGWMWLVLPLLIRSSRVRYTDQLGNLKHRIQERTQP